MPEDQPKLDFKIQAVIERTELWVLINGKEYVYLIDGALLPELRKLYSYQPGKALAFLKSKCYHCEQRR